MTADYALVRRLEEHWFNAWPALRILLVDGWAIRLAEGSQSRANGACPFYPGSSPPDLLIDRIDAIFARADLSPLYRLNTLESEAVRAALRRRGYQPDEETAALLSPDLCLTAIDPDVILSDSMSERWFAQALNAHGWTGPLDAGLRRIFDDLAWPCAFATVTAEDGEIAWGLAVLQQDCVGLFDLVVAPHRRGQGHGRRLVRALMSWGGARGAERAYLHVRTDNEAALRLYGSLGFQTIYASAHFVRPSRAEYAP